MKLELIATATFGLEAVVRREIEDLGYKVLQTEDGKVTFQGDERAIVRANLWLRCADRVLLKMAQFEANVFEDLFQQTKGIPWEDIIPIDGAFTVIGTSVKSKLHSVPACQRTVKKAIAERLGDFYSTSLEETGEEYTIKVTLLKDRATLTMDTSGVGLHKRGYRVEDVTAPMKETLAAALVKLSFWNKDRYLVDPCCGSGTIAIEAALMGRNIAPGLNRSFASENWQLVPKDLWKEERKEAFSAIEHDRRLHIFASDKSKKAIEASTENALEAGIEDTIIFKAINVKDFKASEERGVIVTNPPYGERIGEKNEIEQIYGAYKKFFEENPTWSLFIITSDKEVEDKIMGRPADRRRKLYNGRIETTYYQFHGKK